MIGPKEKKERALGVRLGLKGERCQSPKCAMVRKPYRPGVHGPQRQRRGVSEYGLQLKEKQKFKLAYGLDERNLHRLFEAAARKKGSTAETLLELLERRLENVVFLLGLARSRIVARQLIRDGHVLVNGKKVRSPGFQVRIGDIVALREASKNMRMFNSLREFLKKYEPPQWLRVSKDTLEGQIIALPRGVTPPFEINLLVESLSK